MSSFNALKNKYDTDGFVLIRGLFSIDYVNTLINESKKLYKIGEERKNADPIKYNHVNGRLYRIDPIIDLSDVFSELVVNRQLISVIEFIQGQEVSLLKDKLIYKPSGARGYPMHQDYAWCQGKFPKSLFSVLICLCHADKSNGGVEFFPGYHHNLLSKENEFRHMNDEEIAKIDLSRGELIPLEPGDVVVFSGLTPHRSSENLSEISRPQLYISYNHRKDGDYYKEYWKQYKNYSKASIDSSGNYVNPYDSK